MLLIFFNNNVFMYIIYVIEQNEVKEKKIILFLVWRMGRKKGRMELGWGFFIFIFLVIYER